MSRLLVLLVLMVASAPSPIHAVELVSRSEHPRPRSLVDGFEEGRITADGVTYYPVVGLLGADVLFSGSLYLSIATGTMEWTDVQPFPPERTVPLQEEDLWVTGLDRPRMHLIGTQALSRWDLWFRIQGYLKAELWLREALLESRKRYRQTREGQTKRTTAQKRPTLVLPRWDDAHRF